MKILSTEKAIEALYTVRAYYASLTAGYPEGKDCRGIGDVMCSEIANSCLMAIKALEQTRWIPCSERLPEDEQEILFSTKIGRVHSGKYHDDDSDDQWYSHRDKCRTWNNVVTAWMPLPEPYRGGKSE